MTKKSNMALVLLFCGFLGAFFLLNLLLPDSDFSPRENRQLQTAPKFTFSALFRGDFTKKMEDYSADQFPFRDRWISAKAAMELLQGKEQNNGVFYCGERLLEPFAAPSEQALERRVGWVNGFAEKVGVPVTVSLIPTSAEIYAELLPSGAENDSQAAVIRSVGDMLLTGFTDLSEILSQKKSDYVFYRTDHHWTSLGAWYAYDALGGSLGYTPRALTEYAPEAVSDSFFGTLYSSSGFFWLKDADVIHSYVPDEGVIVERYDTAQPTVTGLYDTSALETKDQYRYFLGGNCPRIVVKTGHDDLPSLLIVRDSFADSLLPFLQEHFSEIHLLDLRYYYDSPSAYVESNGIDRVLILLSVDDFCTENNLNLLIL